MYSPNSLPLYISRKFLGSLPQNQASSIRRILALNYHFSSRSYSPTNQDKYLEYRYDFLEKAKVQSDTTNILLMF